MERMNKKMICIGMIVIGVIAMINLSKSGSIISTSVLDNDMFESSVPGLKVLMYFMIVISICFLGIAGYKYFRMGEKENIYAVGIICAVLMLITACNGLAFYGNVLNIDDVEQPITVVGAFVGYLGISKLAGYISLGAGIWAGFVLFKGDNSIKNITNERAAIANEGFIDNNAQ